MNKNTIAKWLAPAALLGLTALPTLAQDYPMHHDHPGINARLRDQNRRIEQGERSGSLTPREAYRLERRDAQIRRQEYHARISGGRFSPQERARLQREENRASGAIYRQKHDDQHRY